MDRKELMRNVPESENGYIKVPAIMDNGRQEPNGKLYDKSLTELHDLLVSKEITAVDLTEETLNRIQDTEEQLGSLLQLVKKKQWH